MIPIIKKFFNPIRLIGFLLVLPTITFLIGIRQLHNVTKYNAKSLKHIVDLLPYSQLKQNEYKPLAILNHGFSVSMKLRGDKVMIPKREFLTNAITKGNVTNRLKFEPSETIEWINKVGDWNHISPLTSKNDRSVMMFNEAPFQELPPPKMPVKQPLPPDPLTLNTYGKSRKEQYASKTPPTIIYNRNNDDNDKIASRNDNATNTKSAKEDHTINLSSARSDYEINDGRYIFFTKSTKVFQNKHYKENSNFPFQSNKSVFEFIHHLPVTREHNCDKYLYGKYDFTTKPSKLYRFIKQRFHETFDYTNCARLRKQGFEMLHASQKELDYPIAYSILVYKDASQVTRLLRSIYRSHNAYCIHVDLKSNSIFQQTISNLTSCFENVFLARQSVDVKWGTFTVLEPELICMRDLIRNKIRWKYWINLTGQEFPLKTNLELVNILDNLNGTNLVHGLSLQKNNYNNTAVFDLWRKRVRKAPPEGINLHVGGVHVILSRDFISFVLRSEIVNKFIQWLKRSTKFSDEFFFGSVNYSPALRAPGSSGDNKLLVENIRFKIWKGSGYYWNCYKKKRHICILSLRELPLLTSSNALFANKFLQSYSPVAYSCLEYWHFRKIMHEFS